MKRIILTYISVTLFQPLYSQSSQEILGKAIKYYEQISSGSFEVKNIYKSSLKNSPTTVNFSGEYFKQKEASFCLVSSKEEKWHYLSTPKEAFLFSEISGEMEKIKKKERNWQMGELLFNEVPFNQPAKFFSRFIKETLSTRVENNEFILESKDGNKKLVFDKGSYALKEYLIVEPTKYGIQRDEWHIERHVKTAIGKTRYNQLKDSLEILVSRNWGVNTMDAKPDKKSISLLKFNGKELYDRNYNQRIYDSNSVIPNFLLLAKGNLALRSYLLARIKSLEFFRKT